MKDTFIKIVSLDKFGPEVVRPARKALGWNQTELAQKAGCGIMHISNIEKGKEIPLERMKAIVKALGLTMNVAVAANVEHFKRMLEVGYEQQEKLSEA